MRRALALVLVAAAGCGGGGGARRAASPAPAVLRVTAKDVAFDTATLTVPAGRPLRIVLDNRDRGTQHNIAIYTDASATKPLFRGELFAGVATRTYRVGALGAGEYFFRCDVHPTQMTGRVVAR